VYYTDVFMYIPNSVFLSFIFRKKYARRNVLSWSKSGKAAFAPVLERRYLFSNDGERPGNIFLLVWAQGKDAAESGREG
jgi:hypothetical protein